jgi:hypothetical protein
MHKKPKATLLPRPEKTPRKAGFDENPMRLKPAWRVGRLELCDPYGWHELQGDEILEVLSKLKSFESMLLAEILGSSQHHQVKTESLCKEARDRLEELNLDDIEELLSLRVTGVKRVWGILEHNVVILLWWDPDHQVCPAPLRNT